MKKICVLLAFLLVLALLPVAAVQENAEKHLFFDDFEEKDGSRWTTEGEEPLFAETQEGDLSYSVESGDYFEKQAMDKLRNYAFSFDLYMDYRDAEGNFGTTWPTIRFRVGKNSCYHMYLYNEQGKEEIGLQKIIGGEEYWLGTASVPLTEDNEKWVRMKIELTGGTVAVYYDDMDKPVISVSDTEGSTPGGGGFCFIKNSAAKFYIDNLTVTETQPEQPETEKITKKTDRELYRFYDYESGEGTDIVEETGGNHYLHATQTPAQLGEYQDFVCRLNWKKDYKPYGENNAVFSFGGGYEIEFDSTLENGGIVLKKNGAELVRKSLWLADYDDCWTAVGFSAVETQVEVYYADMETPLIRYEAEEPVPFGAVVLSGGGIDNLYLASAYRQKPIEILKIESEEVIEAESAETELKRLKITVNALSHLETDLSATAIVAGYKDGQMCALAQNVVNLAGNDCNKTEKIETEILLEIPQTDGAEYVFYLWDGLLPLSDFVTVGETPERQAMAPDDGEAPLLAIEAKVEAGELVISGSLEGDAEQSITLLVQKMEGAEITPDIQKATYLTQVARPMTDGTFLVRLNAEGLAEGDYVIFAATDDAETVKAQVEYLKQENLDGFLGNMNLATDADALRVLLSDPANTCYAKRFGIDADSFIRLGQETLQNGVCMRALAEKGEGFIAESVGGIFAPHIAFALLKTAQDGVALRTLMTENAALYPLDNETDKLYLTAEEKVQIEACAGLVRGFKKGSYDNLAEVMADIEPNTILAMIYAVNYKDIPALLKTYETKLGIDLDELEDFTAAQKNAAYQGMNASRCYSFAEFRALYESAITSAAVPPSPTPKPSSGGGSGGGGGGGFRVTVQATSIPTTNPTAAPREAPQEPQNDVSYPDVSKEHWAYESVAFLSTQKPPAVNGYADGCFYPDKKVTRAEFVKLMMQAFHFETGDAACNYSDVAAESWYYPAIATATQAGIVKGKDDGTFRPNEEISRQDMAVMLLRVAERKLISLEAVREPAFPDGDTVSVYAQKAVETLAAAGVINGAEDGRLNPFSPATRAQAVKMIYEILR